MTRYIVFFLLVVSGSALGVVVGSAYLDTQKTVVTLPPGLSVPDNVQVQEVSTYYEYCEHSKSETCCNQIEDRRSSDRAKLLKGICKEYSRLDDLQQSDQSYFKRRQSCDAYDDFVYECVASSG